MPVQMIQSPWLTATTHLFNIEYESDVTVEQEILGDTGHRLADQQDVWLEGGDARHAVLQKLFFLQSPKWPCMICIGANGLPISLMNAIKSDGVMGVGDVPYVFVHFEQGSFVVQNMANVYQMACE